MSHDWVLQTRGLCKEFRGFKAVHNVDLNVKRHSIHALIGPNGAGKTTCFNLITGMLRATSGSILLNGEDITQVPPAKVANKGMVRSFQISAVFPNLSVRENILVALQAKSRIAANFIKHIRVLKSFDDRVESLAASVGLSTMVHQKAGSLSYGRKRALEIATTLAMDPEVLLLDEPLAGMGHEDVERTAELIREIARDRTVLMVEHNITVVAKLSDTISVLRAGELLAEGSYQHVSTDPAVIEAYMGSTETPHD